MVRIPPVPPFMEKMMNTQAVVVYTPMEHFIWSNFDPALFVLIFLVLFFVTLVGAIIWDKIYGINGRKRK